MRFPKSSFIKYIKYTLALFEILLGIRLGFRFLGANPQAPIVDFLYTLTDVISSPFQGIFSDIQTKGGGVFDLVTVATMIGYPVLVYLLVELVHLITKKDSSDEGMYE